MNIKMTKAEDGKVLRLFLTDTLGLSARAISSLKKRADGILLNGTHATVRAVLHEGDELSLSFLDTKDAENEALTPEDLPLDILYEDDCICVCNKPSGMPTHPSLRHRHDTLANALAYYYRGAPYVFRAVNRLDKDTSGVVLTAKNAFAAAKLSEAMKKGEIKKEYLAIAHGITSKHGEITDPIRRACDSIILREVCREGDKGAEGAITLYEKLTSSDCQSLLRVHPITGRTHQIRVHMASVGHPLVGDVLYGKGDGASRLALHAYSLSFPHPITGKTLCVTAPIPSFFFDVLPSLCALTL